jgi:hypothetical protein
MNSENNDLNLKEVDADVIANKLLKDMVKIKTDIEHFEIILKSLKIKYKDTQTEYSNIYALTTEAKEIELEKKEKCRQAWEIDKALFLERQQNKLLKVVDVDASKNIGNPDADSIDL